MRKRCWGVGGICFFFFFYGVEISRGVDENRKFTDVFFSSFFVFQWSMQFDGIIFLHMNSDHDFCHILSGLLDVVVLNRVF